MLEPEPCDLHRSVTLAPPDEADELLRLARSPIGDECRNCAVCRLAREYVYRRLEERAGRVFPPDQTGEAVLLRLQAAVENAKVTVHRPE